MSAPKLAESIPAVTAPVKLPKLVPSRFGVWGKVGAALIVLNIALLGMAVMVA